MSAFFGGALQRLFLTAILGFPFVPHAYADEPYPPVYYRNAKYDGEEHCIPVGASKNKRELYFLKKSSASDLTDGKPHNVGVAEFFSGRRYRTRMVPTGEYRVTIATGSSQVELSCGLGKASIGSAPDKSEPINERGEYLNLESVDTSGKWGDYPVDRCDSGRGWVDCDIGVNGLSLRNVDGTVRWARILAVSTQYKTGHPIYRLPDAIRIESRFNRGTLLDDGTAVLTFWGLMSVRVDLIHGTLLENRPDVTMVSLDDWATLKRIMNERWRGADRPCMDTERFNSDCDYSLTQMYMYTLQNYLFPLNKALQHSSGARHGKPE